MFHLKSELNCMCDFFLARFRLINIEIKEYLCPVLNLLEKITSSVIRGSTAQSFRFKVLAKQLKWTGSNVKGQMKVPKIEGKDR